MSETRKSPLPKGLIGHSTLPWQDLSRYFTAELRREATSIARVTVAGASCEVNKYGVLGSVIAEVPVVLYDHPALVEDPKQRFSTAFTTGDKIYVNAFYAMELLKQDYATRMSSNTTLAMLLHEASHIARGHTQGRLADAAPHADLNIVFDACINASLLKAWPHLNGVACKTWAATAPAQIEHFHRMSEEEALAEYRRDPEAFLRAVGFGPSDSQSTGRHFINSRELARFFEEHGLAEEMKELGLPESNDVAAHERLTRELVERMTRAADVARREKAEAARIGGRTPGAHIDDVAIEQVGLVHQPRLHWKLQYRRVMRSLTGTQYGMSDEVPDPIRYTPPGGMGFNTAPYIPGYAPVGRPRKKVLCIVDTSGSMSNNDLSECFTEIFGLARQRGAVTPDVIIHCADTALRADPIKLRGGEKAALQAQNERQVKAYGRGGTDLSAVLNDVCRLYARDIHRGEVAGVLYFSDLGDAPPTRPRGALPSIAFICPESTYCEQFDRAVGGWAAVVPIRNNELVMITDIAPMAAAVDAMSGP